MTAFISRLAQSLGKRKNLAGLTVVFPNKRPAAFLSRELTKISGGTVLLPEMLSISEFIEKQTPFLSSGSFERLLDLYDAYCQTAKTENFESQSLEQFLGWSPVLMTDFDEIDKFLVPAGQILGNVAAIKEMEAWSETMSAPSETSGYIRFFKSLPVLYERFREILTAKGKAYEGMLYRYAAEHIDSWSADLEPGSIVFAGFNALTPAEHQIITRLVRDGKAGIHWDIHRFYLDEPFEAGRFLRRYRKDPVLAKTFPGEIPEGVAPDSIHRFVETPGLQSQFQWLSATLEKLPSGADLLRIAVVLPDASAVNTLLHTLPDLPAVNITFGLNLRQLPVTRWWMHYLQWLRQREEQRPVDILELAEFFESAFSVMVSPGAAGLAEAWRKNPIRYIPWNKIPVQWTEHPAWQTFFGPRNIKQILQNGRSILENLLQKDLPVTGMAALTELYEVWDSLETYHHTYAWFNNLRSLEKILTRLLDAQALAFEGHPLKGLQVMGLLETRLLDFDRVYVLAANEGLLPSTVRAETFLPADLRRHFKMPLTDDKNAIAAYHFYRLISSARECTYLYTATGSGLNEGEPSRFIAQLKHKLPQKGIKIREIQWQAGAQLQTPLTSLPKDPVALERLRHKALTKGFSPSFLYSYLHHPADFYRRYILGWKDDDTPQAFVPANILGTVIHNTMEHFYHSYVNAKLTPQIIGKMFPKVDETVKRYFLDEYLKKPGRKTPEIYGKNLLAVNAAAQIVRKFLAMDKDLAAQSPLQILGLEQKIEKPASSGKTYKAFVEVPGIGPVYFNGILDRLDIYDNTYRMVDYKTGDVKQLKEKRFRDAVAKNESGTYFANKNYKYFLQLWMYVWMARRQGILPPEAEIAPVIYSPRQGEVVTFPTYTPDDDSILEQYLRDLLAEIFDPSLPFVLDPDARG